MKHLWQWLIVGFVLGCGSLVAPILGHAEAVGYTVQVVKPANQDDHLVDYFAVRTHPGQRQKLAIVIQNQQDRQQRFRVEVTQAVTNANGVIDYSQFHPQLDPSLQVQLQRIFSRPSQQVTVPADSRKRVTLAYQMPTTPLKGCVLGGVYVQQINPEHEKTTSKISLKNVFTYAVSIRIRESARDVAPALRLQRVQVAQVNRRNLVTANLQNYLPGIMPTLAVRAQVTPRNQSRVILRQNQTNLGMAPNSNFNYAIPWNQVNLRAGKYTLHLTAKAGRQEWQFVKNFTVTPQALRKLGPTVQAPAHTTDWLDWLFASVVALLLIIIGYLLYRNRQRRSTP